jgi:hypothetical protein
MKTKRIWALGLFAGLVAQAAAQADSAVIDKIVDEGKNRSHVMAILRHLTKNIGPRLTGSPNLDKAYEWTQAKFREFGCTNVHLEEWGEWPVGFDRGLRQTGRMIAPVTADFQFTTSSWTPGTNGRKRGPAVLEPTTMDEFQKVKDRLRGSWLIRTAAMPRGELTGDAKALEDAILASGAYGRVMASRNDLVITSGRYNITWENLPTQTRITVRKRDMDLIQEHLGKGADVQLEFDIDQKFVKGPRKHYNVVAEIPGTEKPDEVVIMGGHLDSWDGPGSEGAADNGTGSSVTLEVARILGKAGARPKRTIRFILFSGEEQGLFGSRAYVEKHKDELSKISAVFIEDSGANYESGTYAMESMAPFFTQIIETNNKIFPDMQMRIRTVQRMPRGGGSDHASFNAVGVPGFFWDKAGTTNYQFIHHTQHDKYELVPEKYMVQMAVNNSVATYVVACAPTMMPRETPPPAK